jgi:hypothetical protein
LAALLALAGDGRAQQNTQRLVLGLALLEQALEFL